MLRIAASFLVLVLSVNTLCFAQTTDASGMKMAWLQSPQETQSTDALPPGEAQAKARLNTSPRHGQWIDVDILGDVERCARIDDGGTR